MKKFIHKNIKKIISIMIVLLMMPFLTVSAKDLSKYAKEISEAQKWQLEGQVELVKQEIATVYNGSLTEPLLYNNHTVQWLSVGSESAVKPVVWSAGTAEGWQAKTLTKMVEDYETSHPGYIVVGAINGDFFDNSVGGTGEPTNFHVQEGDVLRAAAPGASYRGVLGFGQTNKEHVAVFGQQHNAQMSLEVLENNKTIKTLTVARTNDTPSSTGVNVYTKHLSTAVNLDGYTVYEGTYTMYRDYSGGYFLKGTINGISNVNSLTSVTAGKFYVAAKEAELNAGDTIKIEYNLSGELEGIENAVGFVYQVLKDGQPQLANTTSSNNPNAQFINTTHPRTLVGFKADGSVVLMVIDGRGSVGDNLEGASLFQCGELLRLAGCVEGYNLDGGGSSTLMARINGELTLINDPSDARQTGQPWGTLRSTGNAVLLVMKDPKLAIEEPVGNTITIKKIGDIIGGTLQNVKLKIDSKEYDVTGDGLTITGLKKNMEYNVSYSYEILNDDGTIEKGQTNTYVLTTEDYVFPEAKSFEESTQKDGTITFKYRVNDADNTIKKMYIQNGDAMTVVEELSGKVTIDNIDTTIENAFVLMAELENGQKVQLGEIVYEANSISGGPADTPNDPNDVTEKEKAGCKKDLTIIVVSMISLSTLGVFIKKKR